MPGWPAVLPPRKIEGVAMGDENSLAVGPGEPGPGDDWKFPTEPIDGATIENAPAAQPADPTEAELHRLDR
jgi:hypothetical protein